MAKEVIYLQAKLKEKQNFYGDFENSNFKVYVGIFNSDNLEKRTYLSKEENNYFGYNEIIKRAEKIAFIIVQIWKNCFMVLLRKMNLQKDKQLNLMLKEKFMIL